MTVRVVVQRKVVEVGYEVEGQYATLAVSDEAVKEVPNHGTVNLTFPGGFAGTVPISVQGSKPGSEPDVGEIIVI